MEGRSANGRTYGDRCGVARALDVVGERWALLVVRELLLGPKRFTDLHDGLSGVSQNVLSQRLQDLERAEIVRRRRLGPPGRSAVYELTQRGLDLEPILIELGRWGRSRPFPEDSKLSVDALMLALKTSFQPSAAGELEAVVTLSVEDDGFRLEVSGGRLALARGGVENPDAAAQADVQTIRDMAFGDEKVTDAVASGTLLLEGDERTLQRLFHTFSDS